MRTEAQIKQDLTAIDNAIATLIAGKRFKSVTVNSGDSERTYDFTEVNYETLVSMKNDFSAELQEAQGTQTTGTSAFRTDAVQLKYEKQV